MTAVIENCVSLKMRTHDRIEHKRPINNARRAAWFLACARKKAKNPKEILAAFQKGISAWKRFERQTAFYHITKFLEKMEKEYQKKISLSATVGDQTKNPERVRVSASSSHDPSDDSDGSGGDDDPDGDPDDPDPDSDRHKQQIIQSPPKNDHSIQIGGGRHA